jgi:hypothetical protein
MTGTDTRSAPRVTSRSRNSTRLARHHGVKHATAVLAKHGVTTTWLISAAADARPALEPAAVDLVPERNHALA